MNRHTKVAIIVFPFLLLGGYIAAGYFRDYQANQDSVTQLFPEGACDVLNQHCVLKSGEFKINVYDDNGQTWVNSTFPLDKATLFLVEADKTVTTYVMTMSDNPYYWQASTPLRARLMEHRDSDDYYKIRLIAEIKGGKYISEFYTYTTP